MIYIVSFIIVFLVFMGMAIGVLLSGKPIAGSCGGLSCLLCRGRKKCAQRAHQSEPLKESHGA